MLTKTNDAQGDADNSPALMVGGTRDGAHMELDANEIIAKASATEEATLYLNSVTQVKDDDPSLHRVRNIHAGTSDMTAGTTSLATGRIYFVYE